MKSVAMRTRFFVTIVIVTLAVNTRAEDWPQFRGPGGRGVSETANPPIVFGQGSNLVWKGAVPSGYSSPVVEGERVFLTALNEGRLETLAFHRKDGRLLWRERALPEKEIVSHNLEGPSPASPTPVTDGNFVYVFFGACGVIAYNLDGHEQWRQPLTNSDVTAGSSPILIQDKLIIRCDREGGAFIEARDKKTGRQLWTASQTDFGQGFSTPFHWIRGKEEELVVSGSRWLTSFNPATGAENWRYAGSDYVTTSSPAEGESLLFSAMFNGDAKEEEGNVFGASLADFANPAKPEGSKNENAMVAINPRRKGDITATCLTWKSARGVPSASSPVFYKGRLFTVKNDGLVSAYNGKTGEPVFQNEHLNTPGGYCASLVAAAGRIYCASENGVITIIDAAADRLVVLARNDISERIIATPALVDRTIILRTEKFLYAFGEKR